MGQWKIRGGIFEEIREELEEMENSFSGGEILRGGNVKFTNGGLSFSLFYFPFSFSFHFIFLFFYF